MTPAERLFFAMNPTSEDQAASTPMREAQLDTLLEVLSETNIKRNFIKGDIVHFFGPSSPYTKESKQNLVFMFWRYLTDSPQDIYRVKRCAGIELACYSSIDCLIALFDGRNVRFEISSSELLIHG